MKNRFVRILLLFILASPVLLAKDNAYGPWNIDVSAGLYLESNNNVFFERNSPSSDIIWQIMPKVSFEYEQLDNVLFEAALELNSNLHSKHDDADITEMFLHIEAKPVRYGGYFLFSEDYERYQTYSPSDGLLKVGVNILKIGGGYENNHLDVWGLAAFTKATFSPSLFNVLNYSRSSFEFNVKYRYNSFYWLTGINSGRLNYSSSVFNDGKSWSLRGGVGKKFSPKTSMEFLLAYLNENHIGSGADDFKGLLFSLDIKHISQSGKSSIRLGFEREVVPSTVVGSDYARITTIRLKSNSKFTLLFSAAFGVIVEFDSIGSRDDRVFGLDFSGNYTPKKWLTIDFGAKSTSRRSDVKEFSFSQFTVFLGVSAVY